MAKKQETKKVVPTPPVVEQPKVVKQEKVETLVMEKPLPKKDTWELKNRIYYLKGGKKPVSRSIRSSNIYYFDEEKGYERELKYC